MTSKMEKAHKSIANDASLDRKEKHVSSEIKGKLGSGRINGKGHSKLKTPCLTKTTQESGKKKKNLAKKEKHVSSEIKGKLGSGRINVKGHSKLKMPCLTKTTQESGKKKENLAKKDKHDVSSEIKGKLGSGGINGKGHSKLKMPCLTKTTQESGKRKENLDKKDMHVSSENKGRLGNRSGGEGDGSAKTLPKINKRCESRKSTGSLDRKEMHVSLKNEGRPGNHRSNDEGEPHLMALSKKKKQHRSRKENQSLHNKDEHGSLEKDEKNKQRRSGKKKKNQNDPNLKMPFHNKCETTAIIKKIWERAEKLDQKDKHVSLENNCRLNSSWSGGDGGCNLKTLSNGSLDRKEEHVSSKNEGRLSNSMDQDHAWMNQKKSVGGGTPGHQIGKLFVSNTEIAKGSSGTIVLEGLYEGRSVAVKRLVQAHHHVASQEIRSLTASDGDPNIVRFYGVEYDQNFVYLALERCACSLDDLIRAHSNSSVKSVFPHNPISNATVEYKMHLGVKGTMQDVNLWREDGHPSPLLLQLMRGVVSGLVHLHRSGIIHQDLRPQNILITKELCAKLSGMGISRLLPGDTSSSKYHVTGCGGLKVSEQLCPGQQTSSVDVFGLGCVLFFCITGGRHPFGDSLKGDSNIKKNTMDLSPVEFMPEATDLFARLLNRDPNLRPKASEVLRHPLFWDSKMRLSFLRDISDWVKSKAWGTNSDAPEKLESIAQRVFNKEWEEKIDCEFMKHMRKFRAYEFKRVEDLLRLVRNTFSHYRELPPEIQEIVGSSPEDLFCYFTRRFPRLLIETYRFVSMSLNDKEPSPFPEYFNS